jgi:uncharacterized protein YukE
MGDSFHTRSDAIQKLAAEFSSAADDLKALTRSFEAKASAVGSAFGLLGACTSASGKYESLVGETATGLFRLDEVLSGDSDGLRHNAGSYQATEQHNTRLLGGR